MGAAMAGPAAGAVFSRAQETSSLSPPAAPVEAAANVASVANQSTDLDIADAPPAPPVFNKAEVLAAPNAVVVAREARCKVVHVAEATRWRDDNKDGDYVDKDREDPTTAFLVPPCSVDMADLSVIYGLGKGGFSAVMLVQRKADGELFALKVISKSMMREPKHRKRLQVERVILQALEPNPFIARLTTAFQTESELFFLMDYCAGGDLCYQCFRIFSKIDRFNDGQARFYVTQITLAIEHLHKHGYVHRDIKVSYSIATYGKGEKRDKVNRISSIDARRSGR
jgi:hypothetical protein